MQQFNCLQSDGFLRGVLSFLSFLVCMTSNLYAGEAITYRDHVRKILKKHCVGCHNSNRSRAGLDLSSYTSIIRGSESGEVVVTGDAADSFLYLVTAHEEEPAMPPGGKQIPDDHLLILKQWIEGGLLKDESSDVKTDMFAKSSDKPNEADGEAIAPSSEFKTEMKPSTNPSPQLDLVFEGLHRTANKALAVNAEKQLVAVGGQLQVLLFNGMSRQLVGVLPFPEGEPQVLRFSADGKHLLAGGGVHAQSGRVILWETVTGKRIWEGGDEFDVVMATDLSPNGKYVVLGGPERIIKVIDTESHEVVHRIEKHTDWVLATRFGADGLIFATADRDGGVYLWETETGELIHSLRGHTDAVHSIEWQPAEDVCITASEDGTIRHWDLHSGKQLKRIAAHPDGVLGISVLSGNHIFSIGRDESCKAWSSSQVVSNKKLVTLPTSIAAINKQTCVISHLDGSLSIWDFSDGTFAELKIPRNLLTRDLADVIPANFATVESPARTKPSATEVVRAEKPMSDLRLDSQLLQIATKLEQRLQLANEKLPSITQQVAALRTRISKIELAKKGLEKQLNEKIAELESTEFELQELVLELDQMFEVAD